MSVLPRWLWIPGRPGWGSRQLTCLEHFTVSTDHEGRFTVSGLDPRQVYYVRAISPRVWGLSSRGVNCGDEAVCLVQDLLGAKLSFRDPTGQPLPGRAQPRIEGVETAEMARVHNPNNSVSIELLSIHELSQGVVHDCLTSRGVPIRPGAQDGSLSALEQEGSWLAFGETARVYVAWLARGELDSQSSYVLSSLRDEPHLVAKLSSSMLDDRAIRPKLGRWEFGTLPEWSEVCSLPDSHGQVQLHLQVRSLELPEHFRVGSLSWENHETQARGKFLRVAADESLSLPEGEYRLSVLLAEWDLVPDRVDVNAGSVVRVAAVPSKTAGFVRVDWSPVHPLDAFVLQSGTNNKRWMAPKVCWLQGGRDWIGPLSSGHYRVAPKGQEDQFFDVEIQAGEVAVLDLR